MLEDTEEERAEIGRDDRRWDSAHNEPSIETKAELYNFIMSLILRKDKCNNDNKVSNETTTPIHTQCNNLFPRKLLYGYNHKPRLKLLTKTLL